MTIESVLIKPWKLYGYRNGVWKVHTPGDSFFAIKATVCWKIKKSSPDGPLSFHPDGQWRKSPMRQFLGKKIIAGFVDVHDAVRIMKSQGQRSLELRLRQFRLDLRLRFSGPQMGAVPNYGPPPCRVCCSNSDVAIFRTQFPETTICTECCAATEHPDGERGHHFAYERREGWMCRYCGIARERTEWEPDGDWSDHG